MSASDPHALQFVHSHESLTSDVVETAPRSLRQALEASTASGAIAEDVALSVNAPVSALILAAAASIVYVPAPRIRSILESRVGSAPSAVSELRHVSILLPRGAGAPAWAGGSSSINSVPAADAPRVR